MARIIDAVTSTLCLKRKVFFFDTTGIVAKGDKITFATIKNFVGTSELLSYDGTKFTACAAETSVSGLFTIYEPLPNTGKIALQASKFHTDESTLYCLGQDEKQLLLLGNPVTKCLSADCPHIVLVPEELKEAKCFALSTVCKSEHVPFGLSEKGDLIELDFTFGKTLVICRSVAAIYFDKTTHFYRRKCTFYPVYGA